MEISLENFYTEKLDGLDAPIDKVCKLTKYIYILKQAQNSDMRNLTRLYVAMHIELLNLTSASTSRLLKKIVEICLYTDDILISGTDLKIVKFSKKFLLA